MKVLGIMGSRGTAIKNEETVRQARDLGRKIVRRVCVEPT